MRSATLLLALFLQSGCDPTSPLTIERWNTEISPGPEDLKITWTFREGFVDEGWFAFSATSVCGEDCRDIEEWDGRYYDGVKLTIYNAPTTPSFIDMSGDTWIDQELDSMCDIDGPKPKVKAQLGYRKLKSQVAIAETSSDDGDLAQARVYSNCFVSFNLNE